MENEERVLIMCEVDSSEAIEFLVKCESEGLSFPEKLEQMMKNFLSAGDNHLLGNAV